MPFVRNELCAGCGICVEECPTAAIHMKDGIAVIDQTKCEKCGTCVKVCPQQAIRPDSEKVQLKDMGGGPHRHKGGGSRGGHRGGGGYGYR